MLFLVDELFNTWVRPFYSVPISMGRTITGCVTETARTIYVTLVMMDFQILHKYNKLVTRGKVKPFECPACHQVAILMLKGDDPALRCFHCGALTVPGMVWYQKIKAEVEKHG